MRKYEKKGSNYCILYLCTVDLEKAKDGVNRKGVWEIIKMYGVRGHTLGV